MSTAIFGNAFYVSNTKNGMQSSGIRTEMDRHTIAPEQLVWLTGRTATNSDGEKYIKAWSATTAGSAYARPALMNISDLGGGQSTGQDGVEGGEGLNNTGMLIRVCGRIISVGNGEFTLDDGSNYTAICVIPDGSHPNPLWKYVSLTGISSCERMDGQVRRKVLVRSVEDIVPIAQ